MARIAFIDVTVTVSYGGLQTAVWRFAQTLAAMGHAVTVFGGAGSVAPPGDCCDVEVRTFPFRSRERVLDLGSRFQRIVERASFARHARAAVAEGRYDWVILDKPFDFFWPWLLPRASTTRFAFTSGGTDFFAFDRRLARRIDRLLACSHFNAWQIRSHYKRPTAVTYYGVDTRRFAPEALDPALRARLGIDAHDVLFTFAGRLVGWKGMQVAVAAMAEAALAGSRARLLVIGGGPQRPELEALAARLGVAGRVLFHDPVAHDALPAYYAAADVGVFPSIGDEAFGITIAEAMSCGKPVIASHVGGIPEVVGNEGSCGLLVAAADAPALARAMRALIDDPARRAAMGAAARARVERNYTWELAAERLLVALDLKP
jgi:glycosyltransferase involved in cell wall biosynthesis